MLPCLFLAYGVIGWADIVASKLRCRREWIMLHAMWFTCIRLPLDLIRKATRSRELFEECGGLESGEPQLAIGSTSRLRSMKRVVQRVEAVHGNDVYFGFSVVCALLGRSAGETPSLAIVSNTWDDPDSIPHDTK
jgi:hypothetical protein